MKLNRIADQNQGDYVKPPLPGNQQRHDAAREAIKISKQKISRIKG
jgi:hypothetical protein